VIEPGARIGDRTCVLASAYVASPCEIGADCEIHMGAVIGNRAQIRGLAADGGRVEIGPRSVIREHVTIHRAERGGDRTVIGMDTLLLAGCHVAHDCQIGQGATIANGALLAGHVTVGDGAFISGNVLIHQNVRIGALAMIRGQARVVKDVPPHTLVIGESRVCGLNVVGMRRAGLSPAQRLNVKRVYAVVYRSRLNVSQAVERLRTLDPNDELIEWLTFIESSTRGLCAARHVSVRARISSERTTEDTLG
jgi:UDP-N-acetylglucosamine acyltransferase